MNIDESYSFSFLYDYVSKFKGQREALENITLKAFHKIKKLFLLIALCIELDLRKKIWCDDMWQ